MNGRKNVTVGPNACRRLLTLSSNQLPLTSLEYMRFGTFRPSAMSGVYPAKETAILIGCLTPYSARGYDDGNEWGYP